MSATLSVVSEKRDKLLFRRMLFLCRQGPDQNRVVIISMGLSAINEYLTAEVTHTAGTMVSRLLERLVVTPVMALLTNVGTKQ